MKIKAAYIVQTAREFPHLDTWEILDIAATRQERAENRPYNGEWDGFTYNLELLGRKEFLRWEQEKRPERERRLKEACDRLRAARATTK